MTAPERPRLLVVCCDGTWNTPSDDTNVRRVYDRLATTPTQTPHYFPGVGTTGSAPRRALDGALGLGLAAHIQRVYRWIADVWTPGDELVFLGFSRGAFTVRSTVGMLARCGLVRFDAGTDDAARDAIVARIFSEGYRAHRDLPRDLRFQPGFGPDDLAPIAFLGVWDTVGALGVPRTFGLLSALIGRDEAFHDLVLAPDVRHARQALALDERRGPYVPSIWATPPPGRHASFAQLWFPGGHSDVGGGNPSSDLSDGAYTWMVEEATAAVGLAWRDDVPPRPAGHPCGPVTDTVAGIHRLLSPRPRAAPRVVEGARDVHPSAVARRACDLDPPYRRGRVLAVGDAGETAVPADETWVETGLYLEPGHYGLEVSGSWSDHGASSPGTGARPWPVPSWPAYAVGTALDGLRRAIERVSGDERSDVIGSRRVLDARWLELVAVVADDVVDLDGTVHEGTSVPVGATGATELVAPLGGYLYAFANDAWTGYGSNAGAVALRVTRLA